MDSRLKRVFALYCASAVAFAVVLAGGIAAKKNGDSLSATLSVLRQAKGNLVRTSEAVQEMRGAIAEIKSFVPPEFDPLKAEALILTGIDALKSKIRDAEISIASFETGGEEVLLPVTIRAAMRDYPSLVNTVGYLQSLRFPFFSIATLSLSQVTDKEKTAVIYEIKGVMRTPKVKESR
ncbi:MAG: hypothetical protein K8I29_07065 [Alphaproteobacteria bacterium]|uniref:Uncharacterized protein n=1 Tax=Candidatus Nitrobium versatile TaxID=2884831 RepID=A0A953JDY1_9BACT|nr:hypothetical protein [Candidatus Nitrobium versatile]